MAQTQPTWWSTPVMSFTTISPRDGRLPLPEHLWRPNAVSSLLLQHGNHDVDGPSLDQPYLQTLYLPTNPVPARNTSIRLITAMRILPCCSCLGWRNPQLARIN